MDLNENEILLLRGREVRELLDGREREVMDAVAAAYRTHGRGESTLPHSNFLRFPHDASGRIIALPAFLGGDTHVAGMKWIASFPRNLGTGLERASATLILNSADTGRPLSIMEASIVSARRTAASAALAAQRLHAGLDASRVGIVGCGPIALEIVRFLRVAIPEIRALVLHDLSGERARGFAAVVERETGPIDIAFASSAGEVLEAASLVSFATTAGVPHVVRLPATPRPQTILHVSLRDLSAEVILGADNVVDDVDHVCRAETSIHLAEKAAGNRAFVRCTLADVLDGRAAPRGPQGVTIFSPFGLGVLDLAVAHLAWERARAEGVGTPFDSFFPEPWNAEPATAAAAA
ncbi:MAG: 2,3-diaminopropionate biosynthesis protein SbnB [Longimicrobiaceae bacterium]